MINSADYAAGRAEAEGVVRKLARSLEGQFGRSIPTDEGMRFSCTLTAVELHSASAQLLFSVAYGNLVGLTVAQAEARHVVTPDIETRQLN